MISIYIKNYEDSVLGYFKVPVIAFCKPDAICKPLKSNTSLKLKFCICKYKKYNYRYLLIKSPDGTDDKNHDRKSHNTLGYLKLPFGKAPEYNL